MHYDVIVVGGSVAGLSAALVLAQARRTVLVIDANSPRNGPAAQLHGYLGRDGDAPAALLDDGRAEVRRHGGQLREGSVTAVRRSTRVLLVDVEGGEELSARVVVIATGLTDRLPELDGVAQGWGNDVVHCPYCHGVEIAGRPVGVLGGTPMDAFRAQLVRQWSEDVILFTNGTRPPSDDELAQLAARGIDVVDGVVQRLARDEAGTLQGVALYDGTLIAREAVFIWAPPSPNDHLLRRLGVDTEELELFGSWPQVDADGRTGVAGVWAVGNVADPRLNLIAASAHGAYAAAMINHDLVAADVTKAVEAARRHS